MERTDTQATDDIIAGLMGEDADDVLQESNSDAGDAEGGSVGTGLPHNTQEGDDHEAEKAPETENEELAKDTLAEEAAEKVNGGFGETTRVQDSNRRQDDVDGLDSEGEDDLAVDFGEDEDEDMLGLVQEEGDGEGSNLVPVEHETDDKGGAKKEEEEEDGAKEGEVQDAQETEKARNMRQSDGDDGNLLLGMLSMDADELDELGESAREEDAEQDDENDAKGEEESAKEAKPEGAGGEGGEVVNLADEDEQQNTPLLEDETAAAAAEGKEGEPEVEGKPVRYFLARCSNNDALQKSINTGTWQIQAEFVERICQGFEGASKVFLIFCNGQEFCGFASMEAAPGAIDSDIWAGAASGARVCAVDWLCRFDFPIEDGLRNPWNMEQTFRESAPDGQPLPPEIGIRICECMEAASKAAGKRPPKRMVAPGLENGGNERPRSRSRSRSPGRRRERSQSPPSVLDMTYKEYLEWFYRIQQQKQRISGSGKKPGHDGIGGGLGAMMPPPGAMPGMMNPMMAGGMMNPMMAGGMMNPMMAGMMNPMMAGMMNPMMASGMMGGMMNPMMASGMGMMGGGMMGGMMMQTEAEYMRQCEQHSRQTGTPFNPDVVKQYYHKMQQYMQQKQQQMPGGRGGPPPPPGAMGGGRGRGGRGRGRGRWEGGF